MSVQAKQTDLEWRFGRLVAQLPRTLQSAVYLGMSRTAALKMADELVRVGCTHLEKHLGRPVLLRNGETGASLVLNRIGRGALHKVFKRALERSA